MAISLAFDNISKGGSFTWLTYIDIVGSESWSAQVKARDTLAAINGAGVRHGLSRPRAAASVSSTPSYTKYFETKKLRSLLMLLLLTCAFGLCHNSRATAALATPTVGCPMHVEPRPDSLVPAQELH